MIYTVKLSSTYVRSDFLIAELTSMSFVSFGDVAVSITNPQSDML